MTIRQFIHDWFDPPMLDMPSLPSGAKILYENNICRMHIERYADGFAIITTVPWLGKKQEPLSAKQVREIAYKLLKYVAPKICQHGIPIGHKCSYCAEEAIQRMREGRTTPNMERIKRNRGEL